MTSEHISYSNAKDSIDTDTKRWFGGRFGARRRQHLENKRLRRIFQESEWIFELGTQ